MKLRSLFTFFVLLVSLNMSAQVELVDYMIKFNPNTCFFDCCLVVKEGSIQNISPVSQRVQSSAQYSVVVPTGSELVIEQLHNPLLNNQNLTGTIPCTWSISSFIESPAAAPESNFYGIIPNLSPSSFHNLISEGDTIVLFSISVTPLPDCGTGVRLFDNDNDPDSAAEGMQGGNFSNGFTIGGANPKYNGNLIGTYPNVPVIMDLTSSCTEGIEIWMSAQTGSCQGEISYRWFGPEGFSTNTENVSIPNATQFNSGMYYVTVVDEFGCTATSQILANAKPIVGPNQSVQCFSSGTATISAEGPGQWSVGSESPGTAVINGDSLNNALVSSFSTFGTYYLIRSFEQCSDTLVIEVGNNCTCSVLNSLSLPIQDQFCNTANAIHIFGSEVVATGNYIWQQKLNNGNYQDITPNGNQQNYTTLNLNEGYYYFRRIFHNTTFSCFDTSNHIMIYVAPEVSTNQHGVVSCYESEIVSLSATGAGFWQLSAESEGTLQVSAFTNNQAQVSQFSNPGNYYMVWSNGVCSDTTHLEVFDYCDCNQENNNDPLKGCKGQNLFLEKSCPEGVWSQANSNPAGASILNDQDGVAEIHFSESALGSYMFIYNISNNFVDTVEVVVHELPMVSAGEDFEICENAPPVLLVASGALQYVWSTGQTSSNIFVNPTQSTTISVTGTDIHGCPNQASIDILVHEKPEGMIPHIPHLYIGDDLELMSGNWTNANFYEWSGPLGFSTNQQNPVISNVTLDHSGTYSLLVTNINECSAIATIVITILETILPVTYGDVAGYWEKTRNRNIIAWTTLSERNSDKFILQKSIDGKQFYDIGAIDAAGNSYSKINYQFEDEDVRPNSKYYYRIKQIDLDQFFQYSVTIVITTGEQENIHFAKLFPNPSNARNVQLLFNHDIDEPLRIDVWNSNGEIKHSWSKPIVRKAENVFDQLNEMDLSSGIYFIKINSGNGQQILKWLLVE